MTATVAAMVYWVSARRAKGTVMQTMSVKGLWCVEHTIVIGDIMTVAGNLREMKGRTAQVMWIALMSLFAALIISAGILVRVPPHVAVKGSRDIARRERATVMVTLNVKAAWYVDKTTVMGELTAAPPHALSDL